MLPGPPKECTPLFEKYVMPTLKEEGFLSKQTIYRWLTMGLSEGAIAPEIDALVKPYAADSAYRYCYPYIEIKVIAEINEDLSALITKIEKMLASNLVSQNGETAYDVLKKTLSHFDDVVHIRGDMLVHQFIEEVGDKKLIFVDEEGFNSNTGIKFLLESSQLIVSDVIAADSDSGLSAVNEPQILGRIELKSKGYINNNLAYEHTMSAPYRGSDVADYIKPYLAWQLSRFISIGSQGERQ